MLSAELLTLGEAFSEISVFVLASHIPIVLVEVLVVGVAAGYLERVKPQMLISTKRATA